VATTILTHRGIDVAPGSPPEQVRGEGTWESFRSQVLAGFGLEFDVRPMRDGKFAVCHDDTLGRLSGGVSMAPIASLDVEGLRAAPVRGGRLCELTELLELLTVDGAGLAALHVKHACQTDAVLDALTQNLRPALQALGERLLLFDLLPHSAARLRRTLPEARLGASVAHDFDVERFGTATGNTLLTLERFWGCRELYDWAWLDEWDRVDRAGGRKKFVTGDTIRRLRDGGFAVAAVSAELHAMSPGILTTEAHEDASSPAKLLTRWTDWVEAEIDAICTDHASWFRAQVASTGMPR
jgi:glycerophosphoryl diester phosphodiesterase